MTDATIDYLVEYLSKSNKFSCRVSLDKLSNNNKLEDKKKKRKEYRGWWIAFRNCNEVLIETRFTDQ